MIIIIFSLSNIRFGGAKEKSQRDFSFMHLKYIVIDSYYK